MPITGIASQHSDERLVVEELAADGDITVGDDLTVVDDLSVWGNCVVTGDFAASGLAMPYSYSITLAKSVTTDGMNITIKPVSAAGATLGGIYTFDFYMSETNSGAGITADTYSGDLTATAGAILVALVSKKMWRVSTDGSGTFAATLVASANPTDQYVTVIHPLNGKTVVSAASGTNWEGVA